jgi:hypothetical protein
MVSIMSSRRCDKGEDGKDLSRPELVRVKRMIRIGLGM